MGFIGIITITTAITSAAITNTAIAQPIQTIPNGSGGYNTYGPRGVTQTLPNGSGGYNTYAPGGGLTQTLPNGSGGYNTYGQGGVTQQYLMARVATTRMDLVVV